MALPVASLNGGPKAGKPCWELVESSGEGASRRGLPQVGSPAIIHFSSVFGRFGSSTVVVVQLHTSGDSMATGTLDGTQTPASDESEQKFQYPGIPVTCDGAEAVVWVETKICQGSGAFPITSSTTMGSGFNAAVQLSLIHI